MAYATFSAEHSCIALCLCFCGGPLELMQGQACRGPPLGQHLHSSPASEHKLTVTLQQFVPVSARCMHTARALRRFDRCFADRLYLLRRQWR